VQHGKLYARFLQELARQDGSMIAFFRYNTLYTGVNYHFGANKAGLKFYVNCSAIGGNTMERGLHYSILLGVGCAYAMARYFSVWVSYIVHQMANFVAVRQAGGRTYITGGDNAFIFNYHGAGTAPTIDAGPVTITLRSAATVTGPAAPSAVSGQATVAPAGRGTTANKVPLLLS